VDGESAQERHLGVDPPVVGLVDADDPARTRVWQRPQQHPVDDAEDRRVGTDAYG